jgi:RNA polymerase sigma-70 factor, ECF subfamily
MKVPDAFTGMAPDIGFEERLLERQEGSAAREARFCALVTRQSRFVFRVAYAMLRNTQDAEDAVQETFLKLYRGRPWTEIQDERAFLAKVAWQIAAAKRKRMMREAVEVEERSGERDPEQRAIVEDSHAAVRRAIDSLPEELRQPLALSALEELHSGQIARIMGIPEGTVRTRLMRARQLLKQKLAVLRSSER